MCTHTHTPVYFLQESRHETLVLPSDTSDPPVSDELHGSYMGFSDSSVGKESACNAGDPSWIPGWGRSTREGIGHPLQHSWASLVAQLVKNPPAIQETWVGSLGWEDPLEKGKAIHSSNLAWRIPRTVQFMGLQRVRLDWATFAFTLLWGLLTFGLSASLCSIHPCWHVFSSCLPMEPCLIFYF